MTSTPPAAMSDSAAQAATRIWQHWREGSVMIALPDACRPRTRAAGHAAQAALPAVAGRGLLGWKIAATSLTGQAHIGVQGPLAGRLLDGLTFTDGASLSLHGNRMRVAEPEFCFRMARTLTPRGQPYAVDEVLDAVAALHPAIEVPDSRYEDFVRAGEAQLLADNACAGQFVLGAAGPDDWRSMDLVAHAVQADVTPAAATAWRREGRGANVLGDPRVALTWLANELSSLGLPLAAGLLVTTGTCMPPLAIAPGDAVQADFGRLGRVAVRFVD